MTGRHDTVIGAPLVAAAGVLWGTTGTAQALSGYAGSPWALGAARLCVAAVVFLGLAAARREMAALPPGAWPLAALGAACVAAYQPAFFFGVRQTGVAVGTSPRSARPRSSRGWSLRTPGPGRPGAGPAVRRSSSPGWSCSCWPAGTCASNAVGVCAATVDWFARPDRLTVVAYLGIVATVLPYCCGRAGSG